MKKILMVGFLSFLPLLSHAQTSGLKMSCSQEYDGNQAVAAFTSEAPEFSDVILLRDDANPMGQDYLSSNNVCGTELNFSANCSGEVRGYGADVGYFFECSNGISGGITLSGDSVEFNCAGPGVRAGYAHSAYSGCKVDP